MKKLLVFLLAVTAMVSCMAFCVSAATENDVYLAFEDACPEEYHGLYLGTARYLLTQVELDEAQCDKLIEMIAEAKATIVEDYGQSFHMYPLNIREYAVETFKEACELTGLTYEVNDGSDGGIVIAVYKHGVKLADLDGDIVKTTNVAENNTAYFYMAAAAVSMVLVLCAYAVANRKVRNER